jgi:hypothetical protein
VSLPRGFCRAGKQPGAGSLQDSYIVSRIIYLLGHLNAVRPPPCLPSGMGISSHGRYACTQFISRHLLLYSNLIPQYHVPLASTGPNHPWRPPIPFSKTVHSSLGSSSARLKSAPGTGERVNDVDSKSGNRVTQGQQDP